MTDAMNLQQRNVEYERQRHLANWLIESSPHMPKASPQQYQQQQNKKQKKLFTTSIFHDSFFFLSKSQSTAQQPPQIAQTPPQTLNVEQITTNNITNSKTPVFTSQTNLPLQIVQSSRDGNKPKLRRFNSHDTSANMFSVAEFEHARLARRNELELVRQKNRYKMNSLSSGCDSSTGDSKGSKFSNEVIAEESKPELLISDTFLDRFTLPRIARLIAPKSFYELHHQQQQSQSNSLLSKKKSNQYAPQLQSPQSTNSTADDCSTNGELFLLYKHLKNYKIYHAVNAKNGTNRKKGIKIPQDFTGYFSLINDKGSSTATLYTTLIQLVRERVYKFLSVDNMQAYTESTSTDNSGNKSHYVKITAKAGQVFRLLAVFEDGGQEGKSHYPSKKENLNSIGREKEKGRYVQLLSETRQIIYVALSTKGKFYEIEQSNHQLFPKGGSNGRVPKQLNADCVHRISSIIADETVFPIHLKYISKMNGNAFNANIPENIRVTKVSIENSVIACPIDETEFCNPLHLIKIHLQPDFKFIKCFLGFESEKIMFTNQNVQNLLKFCQFNCENFVRALDYELLPKNDELMKSTDNLNVPVYNPVKVKSKSSAFSKFFSSDKHSSAHEKEDSIIFLSKNDLENLENQKQMQNDPNKPQSSVNMKKGWFKNLRNTNNTNTNVSSNSNKSGGSIVNLNLNKSQSMDRYQDMSKLIQERFGNISVNGDPEISIPHHSSTMKSSSEISYDLNETTNKSMQKCFSLQNIELNNSTDMSLQQPDLVKLNHTRLTNLTNITDDDKIERDSSYTTAHHGYSSNESTLNSITEDAMVTKQQSFITEKLFNEFYVKTKQYSKSSSSLHQLLHFSVPQKMNIREMRKNAKLRAEENSAKFRLLEEKREASALAQLQLPPPPQEEQEDDCVLEEAHDEDVDSILIDDELPYCSVRDSIVVAPEDKHVELETPTENIYAEICQSSATPSPSESSTNHMNQVNTKPKNVSSIKISFGNDVYMQ